MSRRTVYVHLAGKMTRSVALSVEETTTIGACLAACVQHFRLAPVDAWGRSVRYTLRSTSGGQPLPGACRCGEIVPADGMHLLLAVEAGPAKRVLISPKTERRTSPSQGAPADTTRRSLLVAGSVLAMSALSGFGAGVTAALAQHVGGRAAVLPPSTPLAMTPSPSPQPDGLEAILVFREHHQTVRAVAWSPDGQQLASASDDAVALIWQATGVVQQRLLHPAPVRALAWSPGGKRLVTAAATLVHFFDAQTGALLAPSFPAHTAPITCLAWSQAQGQPVISGAQDHHAIVWETTTYQPHAVFTRHQAAIEALSCQPRSPVVASASQGGAVRLWQVDTTQELHSSYQAVALPIHALAFAPTGSRLATGGDDGHIRLWSDALLCQQTALLQGERTCVDAPLDLDIQPIPLRTLAWSPDGRFLATGDDGGLLAIWTISSTQGLSLRAYARQAQPVLSLSWSPDQQFIAGALGNVVTVWRVWLV